MRRIRSLFADAKLRTKFLLSFTALILMTVSMISGINYWVSVDAIKRNSSEFSRFLIGQIGINLDKLTTDVERMAFQQFRNSSLSEKLSQLPEGEDSGYSRDKYINDFLNDVLFFEDYYLSVIIIDAMDNRYSAKRKGVLKEDEGILGQFDLEEIKDRRGRALWFRSSDDTLYMAKALYDIPTTKYVGVIVIGVDSGYVANMLADIHDLMDGDVLILNERNEWFVAGSRSGSTQYYMDEGLHLSGAAKTDFEYKGRHYISSVLSTDYDKWKIVQIIDVGSLTRGTESLKYWTISTVLVALLFAFLLAARISKSITESIRVLLHRMSSFTLDFNYKVIVPKSRDEVGMLTLKFNTMAEKINDLFHTVYHEKLLKQQAEYRTLQFEYKALQAQMNPHFLYNTLESIYSLAKIKGEEEIGEMIYLLGKLLRESLGRKGDEITLGEEIEFVRNYLSIHEIIYGDRIAVEYATDERLAGCRVPKFILQPLIENAIVHGIEEKPGKALIRISSREEEGRLLLEVADNGVGMEAEKVERLLNPERDGAPPEGNKKHTNVGVISVHKRIRILYGDGSGLEIRSRPGEGTAVLVRLPVVRSEESQNS